MAKYNRGYDAINDKLNAFGERYLADVPDNVAVAIAGLVTLAVVLLMCSTLALLPHGGL